MMELTARYGLEFNPFLKNSKEILFEGAEYTEARFRLDYLAQNKGFGLLTGAPGRGKTTLVLRSESVPVQGGLFQPLHRYGQRLLPESRRIAGGTGLLPEDRKLSYHPG